MVFLATAILLTTIVALAMFHISTHLSKSGSLVDKFPGPKSWPIIGNLLDLVVSPENQWSALRNWAKCYKSNYRFWIGHWPNVNICDADGAEVLLSSQKNITKSIFYHFVKPWLNEGLLTSTGNKWRLRRKILTPAFHFNILQEFVGVFIENTERMVNTLKEEGDAVVKDVVPLFAKYTLNAVCETAMGTELKDDDAVEIKYRKSVKVMSDILYYRAARPWFVNDWIFSLTPRGRKQAEALKILHDFTMKIIEARKKYHEETRGNHLKIFLSRNEKTEESSVPDYDSPIKKKRLAMLDLLIAAQKETGIIDDLGIREEVDTFIFEGHDTTDMALSFALLLIAEHKEIQECARDEIGSVLRESGGKLGINELNKLTYLDRCIKEALRLFPSVPSISRIITEDMPLKKCMVPRGTIANLHIFDVHRNSDFWPRPDVYDPDRFLPDRLEGRHPFSYIPFSGGPRNCIGQKFAQLEMKVFIGLLLHNFYVEPVSRVSNVRMVTDMIIKSLHPLNVKFIPIG